MSRYALFSILLFFLLVPLVSYAEYIQSFDANIELESDSSFSVTEAIDYVFTSEQHGIFRYIPTKHPQEPSAWYKERYINIDVLSVLLDGSPIPYEETEESGTVYLKIGDPNTTVSGQHRYEITYKVTGGISYFQYGGVEIYWNATGNDWPVPILNARVTLTAQEGIFTKERACYQGAPGESGSCSSTRDEGALVVFTATEVMPGEEVTIAQGIDRNTIEVVIFERNRMVILWVIGLALWSILLIMFVYRYRTEYKTGNTIIAQYEPYQDMKPMYAGLLIDGTLHPEDITACIVYLAEGGYLKIKKVERKVLFFFEVDDYEIILMKSPDQIGSVFQKEILRLLFGGAPFEGNKVTLSDLKTNVSKQKENQKILKELKKELEKDLETEGFYQVSIPTHYLVFAGVAALVLFFFFITVLITALSTGVIFAGVGIVLSLVILSFMYRRRTRKGYEALDHLEGFKEFLSITEKERYTFHNAPAKSPEQFMKYLPYAIAFGVEEEWAEVFKDIAIPDPAWYDAGGAGHFSAVNLTTSLGAFSTAFAASSGSLGGAGGAGSAGGGGGGGGGGSW